VRAARPAPGTSTTSTERQVLSGPLGDEGSNGSITRARRSRPSVASGAGTTSTTALAVTGPSSVGSAIDAQ
jgi:hypothetical protein